MIELSRLITSGSLRQLTCLDLENHQIGDGGMIAFAEALKPTDKFPMGSMGALEELYLGINRIGDPGLQALAGAIGNGSLRSLTSLSLRNNNISDPGMIAFSEALGNDPLAIERENSIIPALPI